MPFPVDEDLQSKQARIIYADLARKTEKTDFSDVLRNALCGNPEPASLPAASDGANRFPGQRLHHYLYEPLL